MKKTLRLIALLLALVLAFGGMLNVQAAPSEKEINIKNALPEALRAAAREEKSFGNIISLTHDYYLYPYGDTNDATVVKGKSIKLEFYSEISVPEYMIYAVEIFRGGAAELVEQIERGHEPEPIDTFVKSSAEMDGGYLSFTWKADSRYPVGDYTMLCFLYDALEDEVATERDSFLSELHVVSEPKPATGITLWSMCVDGWYEVPENGVVGSGLFLPQLSPIPTTDKPDFRLSTNSNMLASTTALYMDRGYIHLSAQDGFARVAVISGDKAFFFWVKGVDYDETKELYIRQDKTALCVGQQDQPEVKRRSTESIYTHLHPYWESADPGIATVDAKTGVVTALRPGTAKITANVGAFSQTIEYTVNDHVFPEGTPVSKRTATQPAQSVGTCTVCGQENCVTVYEEQIFTDTAPNAWYAPNVDFVYENEIMNGMTENTFAPNKPMTRAMVATVLYRVAGSPESEGDIPFTDVAEGSWYADAVRWAAEKGIVNGYDDGTFLPNRNITREQFATILYRYSESAGMDVSEGADLSTFPDAGSVSSYAVDAMRWAVGTGLITGVASGDQTALRPRDNATRAQFATIVARYMAMTDEAPQEEQPVR